MINRMEGVVGYVAAWLKRAVVGHDSFVDGSVEITVINSKLVGWENKQRGLGVPFFGSLDEGESDVWYAHPDSDGIYRVGHDLATESWQGSGDEVGQISAQLLGTEVVGNTTESDVIQETGKVQPHVAIDWWERGLRVRIDGARSEALATICPGAARRMSAQGMVRMSGGL